MAGRSIVLAAALVGSAYAGDKPSKFTHNANVKVDVKLSDRVKPPPKRDNPAEPVVTGDAILHIEELLTPIKQQQEALLIDLLAKTPDTDAMDKADLYFRLGELYAKRHRTARLLAVDAEMKVTHEPDPAAKARLAKEHDDQAATARTALLNAVRVYKELTDKPLFRNYPRMDVALFFYGYTLQGGNYTNEARAVYDTLLKNYPQSKYVPEANFAFAEYYFEHKQLADAEERYRKVLKFPSSSVYLYALYKLGWIDLNLSRPQQALETFFRVAQLTAKNPKLEILNRASKKDFVRAYAEVGKADKALPAFQRVDAKDAFTLLAMLADLYLDQGKSDKAIATYRELMTKQPRHKDVCQWQYNIARSMLIAGSIGDKIHEIENLTRLYGSIGKTLPKEQASECRDNAAEMSGQLARAYHQEAVKTQNLEIVGYADRLYRAYLAVFTDAPDYAETQYFHAELAWVRADMDRKNPRLQTQHWEDAAAAFTTVVETGKLSPERVKASADAAMQAWMKALAIDPTVHQTPVDDTAYDKIPTPKTIPELDQKLIAAFDLYIKHVADPRDDKLVDVKFMKAETLRKHDHLDEAIAIFSDILEHHKDHETARFSAQLILDSYNRLHEFDEMFAVVAKLGADKAWLADKEEIRKRIRVLERQRLQKQAIADEETAKKTGSLAKFVACGDTFLDIYNHDVDADDADKSLYNAGVCFEEGRSLQAAMRVYELLQRLYPKSTVTAKSIVRLGNVYASIAYYRQASEKLEQYAKLYAGEKDAFEALNDAVIYRKGIGDDQKAIDDTMMFIAKFGSARPAMAATAFFSLNAIYDKLGDPDKIVRHLREYVAKYGDKGGADRLVTAWSKIGQTLWQQSCPIKQAQQGSCVKVEREAALPNKLKLVRKGQFCGDDSKVKVTVVPRDERRVREAMAAFTQAIAELDKRGGKVEGDQRGALYYYAMAKLGKAERDYEAYLAVPIPSGLDFDKNKPAIAARSHKRFDDWFLHKRELGVAARKQYEAVVALNDGPTAIASAARLGQISQNFAGQLFRAEIPADVRRGPYAEEASEAYCEELEARANPLEEDALMSYQACLNTSLKLAWFSDLSRVCEYELGQLRPKQFPQSRELSHAPDQLARIGDVEAPRITPE